MHLANLNKITVHCTLCNEEYWIWFILKAMSCLPLKIILCDTGSEDLSREVINYGNFKNIEYRNVGKIRTHEHVELRNEMIKETTTEWFAIVDGDEIWSPLLWHEINYHLAQSNGDILIVPNLSPFPRLGYLGHGDTEHQIAGVKGEYYAKVFRIKNDLQWKNDFYDSYLTYEDGTIISRGNHPSMRVLSTPMTHMTMLPRSPLDKVTFGRSNKLNIGQNKSQNDFFKIPSLTQLPEILFESRPSFVKNPFLHENEDYQGMAPISSEFLNYL